MDNIVWRLRDNGRLLEIFRVNPDTRQLSLALPLKVMKPMTQASAQKYIDDNYPKDKSSIQLAAETIDKKR
jgi:hypothetical protein